MQMRKRKYSNRIIARSVSHGVNAFHKNNSAKNIPEINVNNEGVLGIGGIILLILSFLGLIYGLITIGILGMFILFIITFILALILGN